MVFSGHSKEKQELLRQEALRWILNNFPKFEIINWGGGFKEKTKFLDKERNVLFETNFTYFKYRLKKNPNTTFNISKEEVVKKRKKTNMERYGTEIPLNNSKVKEKFKKTMIERYGIEHHWKNKNIRNKIKRTMVERYENETSFGSKIIKEKVKNTFLKKYGVDNPQKNLSVREKTKNTCLRKYGVEFSILSKQAIENKRKTNLERYGYVHSSKAESVRKKISKSKTKYFYKGITAVEWSEELKCSYTTILRLIKKNGYNALDNFIKDDTLIENKVKEILDEYNIYYVFDKIFFTSNKKYFPDFRIDSHKLIIETDGVYWHSDAVNYNKKYHIDRKNKFEESGYKSLFFREDEILNKLSIVKSIILNKLGFSKKIFARKCSFVCEGTSEFFETNHLMGKGSGRIYSLKFGEEIVASMQVKWKSLNDKSLEISRFCTKNGINVVGGFSKLLKHIMEIETPNKVITFIDRRYGDGNYLNDLGFVKMNEDLSFMWTKDRKVFHRMQFPGNSGYENKCYKLWDCGQIKYVYNANRGNT